MPQMTLAMPSGTEQHPQLPYGIAPLSSVDLTTLIEANALQDGFASTLRDGDACAGLPRAPTARDALATAPCLATTVGNRAAGDRYRHRHAHGKHRRADDRVIRDDARPIDWHVTDESKRCRGRVHVGEVLTSDEDAHKAVAEGNEHPVNLAATLHGAPEHLRHG